MKSRYTLQMEQKSKTFVACVLYTVYNHIKWLDSEKNLAETKEAIILKTM
jgi:hypothetical protein